MKLQEMSTKSLLELHNILADTPAGPKSFATKAKLITKIESVAAAGNIDLASFCPVTADEVAEQDMLPQAESAETAAGTSETRRKSTGKGIGQLARELLLAPAGHPHAVIAEMVNVRIKGAQATANSIRWYACKMRKEGLPVPSRQSSSQVRDLALPQHL